MLLTFFSWTEMAIHQADTTILLYNYDKVPEDNNVVEFEIAENIKKTGGVHLVLLHPNPKEEKEDGLTSFNVKISDTVAQSINMLHNVIKV
jgi:hypothetical protein